MPAHIRWTFLTALLWLAAEAAPRKQLLVLPPDVQVPVPAVILSCTNAVKEVEGESPAFARDFLCRGYAVLAVEACPAEWKTKDGISRLTQSLGKVVDRLAADRRIDSTRIAMAGFGESGFAAFRVGMTHPRIQAVATSAFGFGSSRADGLEDGEVVRASGDRPYLSLVAGPDDFTKVSRTLRDGGGCADIVRRRYAWNIVYPLPDVSRNEVFAFFDEYVKNRDRPLKPYRNGHVRILNGRMKIGQKVCRVVRIPGIAVAPDGTVIVVADARIWNYGDHIDCQPTRTVIRRSSDCGRTWSEPERIADLPWNLSEKWSVSDPSLIVDRQAKKVFYLVNAMEFVRGCGIERFIVCESADNGKTWSAPREITADIAWPGIDRSKDYSFISSGHGIQTQDGTLLHVAVAQDFGVNVFGSSDHGRTWRRFGRPTMRRPDESKIEVLEDGTWLVNSRDWWLRTNHRSRDCGQTWTSTREPGLPDSITNGAILKVPTADGGEALLICNSSRACRPRMHITVRASRDGGRTWNSGVLVDPGNCEYSDLTLMPDGRVAVVYEAEGESAIDFVPIPLDEILASPAEDAGTATDPGAGVVPVAFE